MAWASDARATAKRRETEIGDTKQNVPAASDLAHWYQRVQRDAAEQQRGRARHRSDDGKSDLGDTKQNEFVTCCQIHWYQRAQHDAAEQLIPIVEAIREERDEN